MSPDATISATFSEPVAPGSVQFALSTDTGTVAGTIQVSQTGQSVTFTPTFSLPGGKSFTATVSAADPAGNAMAAPRTWTFTTQAGGSGGGSCPCTVLGNAIPPIPVRETPARPSSA